MKNSFLELLACPECGSPLFLTVFEETNLGLAHNEIIEGLLTCNQCHLDYPIIDAIPRFIPNTFSLFPDFYKKHPELIKNISKSDFEKLHGETQERFGYEWMNYPGSLEEDRKVFLYETQIEPSEWKGKLVLDGGCGMGRYSRVAHELGATVVALDLSPALVRLREVSDHSERMHLVEANLMKPPFKKNIFDIIYSVGVIHHTPSAKESFQALSKLVKPKGKLTVWVYGAPGSFSNFKTNPLKEERQSLKKIIFLVWLIVLIREKISDTLRLFTIHTPHKLLYMLCYPLALIGKIPLIKYLTFSVHPLWRVRLQENFDWLTPPYQSHHTKEELSVWYKENGLKILKVLPHGVVPKPGILGEKE
jgi:SAM-dependent methyltransferase